MPFSFAQPKRKVQTCFSFTGSWRWPRSLHRPPRCGRMRRTELFNGKDLEFRNVRIREIKEPAAK